MFRCLVWLPCALVLWLPSARAQLQLEIKLVERPSSSNSQDQRNIVTLSCTLSDVDTGSSSAASQPGYYYRNPANDVETEVLGYELDSAKRITFVISPDTEGNYFCRDEESDLTSANLELTAYPIPSGSMAQTVYTAQEGGRVTLPCDFKQGKLSQLYTYQWIKVNFGIIINSHENMNINPDKYLTTSNYSLQISGLDDSDNASYLCKVTVNNPVPGGSDFIEQGRALTLVVFDEVKITQSIESQAVREGESSEPFTCVAQGTPLPTIRWTFGGSVLDVGNSDFERQTFREITEITGDNEITSTLTVMNTETGHNVEVVCTATNQALAQSKLLTHRSPANLTVFPKHVSELVLAVAASSEFNKAFVDFNLPDPLLGEVWLHVRYLDDSSNAMFNDVSYHEEMFRNTRSVHYQLPSQDWEELSSFRIQVALSDSERHESSDEIFTTSSNPITIEEKFVFTNTLLYIIIAVGGSVCLLLALIVVTGMVLCCYFCHRRPDCKQKKFTVKNVADCSPQESRRDSVDSPQSARRGLNTLFLDVVSVANSFYDVVSGRRSRGRGSRSLGQPPQTPPAVLPSPSGYHETPV